MEDDARVLEMNWIFLARLMMLHCLIPSPPYFVGRKTRALLIFDNIWSLLSNAGRVGLCIESICLLLLLLLFILHTIPNGGTFLCGFFDTKCCYFVTTCCFFNYDVICCFFNTKCCFFYPNWAVELY